MALDKQNIHTIILIRQNIVGLSFVNPSVVFKKPLEVIPNITANKRYIYPIKFVIAYL